MVRDRVRRVRGRHRDGGVGAEQLAHAADVHHHVLSRFDRPFLQQGFNGGLARPGHLVRIEQHQQMTALVQITPQHVDLAREEISLRAAYDDHRRVGGDILLLCEHQLLGPIVVPAERRGDSAVAVPFRRDRIFLAVTLYEVDLLLLAGHGLDERVRQVLLGIGGRALTAVLVFDDDRAVALDGVLFGLHRLGVRIDVLH